MQEDDRGLSLTKGYIKALSELRSGSEIADSPVLAVYTTETKHHGDTSGRSVGSNTQLILMTEMRLVDGDGHQINARLCVNLAQWGRMLTRGDLIRLYTFTELRYRVNDTSARMPALFLVLGTLPFPTNLLSI